MESRPRPLRWFERLSLPLDVVLTALGLITAWYLFNLPPIAIVGAALAMVLVTIWQYGKRRFGINNGWGKLPVGFSLVGLGIYAFMYPDGAEVLKAVFVVAGTWLTLDALYDLRTGTGANVSGTPNQMKQLGDAAIVGRTLEDEPRSLAGLDTTLELSRRRIENALDILTDTDAIVERNGRYYVTLSDRILTETLRDTPSWFTDRLGGIPARLLRPFRLFDD